MEAVILFSHGSVLCGSGEALEAHACRLRGRAIAPIVEIGYLNYTEPLFAAAVERCIAQGADHILVAPYFLVPGYFVRVDLPKAVSAAQDQHPDVTFTVAEPIGYDDALATALIESAESAHAPSLWRDDMARAPQSCRANPTCPLFGAPECPAERAA